MDKYSMSFISKRNKLTLRFFRNGVYYNSKTLDIPATLKDIKDPSPSLRLVMLKYDTQFSEAYYRYTLEQKSNPISLMWSQNSKNEMSVIDFFKNNSDAKNFIEFCGDISWSDLDNALLYEYKDNLENEDYSTNTIRKYLSNVKVALDKAKSMDIEFPARNYDKILKGKIGQSTAVYLSKRELKSLLNLAKEWGGLKNADEDIDIIYKFLIAAYTGCRYSDMINLKEANMEEIEFEDAEGKIIKVANFRYVSQKTNVLTFVPVKPIVIQLLKRDCQVDINKMNRRLPAICRAAGITNPVSIIKADKIVECDKCDAIRSHTARKSFATNVYISGEYDLRSIAKMVGHKSSSTTEMTYIVCPAIRRSGTIVSYFD